MSGSTIDERGQRVDYIALVAEHGGIRAASRETCIPKTTLMRRLAEQRAAQAAEPVVEAAPAPAEGKKAPKPATAKAARPTMPESEIVVEAEAPKKPLSGGVIHSPETVMRRRAGRRFILSAAQNNTDLLPGFVPALKHLAEDVGGAEILISPLSYNKNGWSQPHAVTKNEDVEGDGELWYDESVQPYLCRESVVLAPGLVFCAELDVNPTAVDPLSGLESYTREASGIVPHTKVAMRSFATMKHEPARFLYTTGVVTMRNYIQRKAGQKASFHHVYGALLVEVDEDGSWFVRQLVASDDGSLHDLGRRYDADGAHDGEVAGIEWGDVHVEKSDPRTLNACFGRGGILDVLMPGAQFFNDIVDQAPRNHHNLKDPHWMAQQHFARQKRV